MQNTSTDPQYLTAVRQLLINRFDLEELRDLCFALGIDYAVFPQWRGGMAREVIIHVTQNGMMPLLLDKIKKLRPDIKITSVIANYLDIKKESPKGLDATNPDLITRAWSQELGNLPYEAPMVIDQIYIIPLLTENNEGTLLRALTVTHGNILWELSFEDVRITGLSSTGSDMFLVSLSRVEPLDGEGMLVALDIRGREIWRYTPGVQFISKASTHKISSMDTPVYERNNHLSGVKYAQELVAVTVDHQWLEILDLNTGEHLLEIFLSSEASLASPVFTQDMMIIPCLAPTLLAVKFDGEIAWRFDAPARYGVVMNQFLCVVGQFIVMTMSNGISYGLHARDGTVAWEKEIGPRGKQITAPISDGTRIYIGAYDGMHALLPMDGREVWVSSSPQIISDPCIWNDVVITVVGEQELVAVDRHTGDVTWQEKLDTDSYLPIALTDGDENGPYAILVDRLGNVYSYIIPTSPELHEAAARWKRAALTWEYHGRLRRAAFAWIRHSKYLMENKGASSECAPAWQSAERLFSLIGDEDRALQCRIEYARCLRMPLISMDVEYKGLVANTWSLLNFHINNMGFGIARYLVIQIHSDQFESQMAMSQELTHLPPGHSRHRRLEVKPLEAGASVPLRVEVSYADESNIFHSFEQMINLRVAYNAKNRNPGSIPVLTQPLDYINQVAEKRSAVDIEIRISAGNHLFEVEVTLDDGSVFSGAKLSKSILIWRPSGNPMDDGKYIFNQLDSDPIFHEAWRFAQADAVSKSIPRRIRLRIANDVPELHLLPWEEMHDGATTLSANPNTPFSRYLPVPKPWGQPLVTRPIKVLGVLSNPLNLHDRYQLDSLDLDLEKYILATSFKGLSQGNIRLEFMPSPMTIEALNSVLRQGYHIVHFVAHGRYVDRSKGSELLLEDEHRNCMPVNDETLARILSHADTQPHLVFLSVCQSASLSSRDAFLGLGPKLVQAGVPAVIAMQDRVRIATARKITQTFYRGLSNHGKVDQALNEARESLLLTDPDALQKPILFMRMKNGRLWDLSL